MVFGPVFDVVWIASVCNFLDSRPSQESVVAYEGSNISLEAFLESYAISPAAAERLIERYT